MARGQGSASVLYCCQLPASQPPVRQALHRTLACAYGLGSLGEPTLALLRAAVGHAGLPQASVLLQPVPASAKQAYFCVRHVPLASDMPLSFPLTAMLPQSASPQARGDKRARGWQS